MHHLARLSFGPLANRPYHAQCACGTAGDFSDHGETRNWLIMHLTRLQGVNSAEFVDETVVPGPVPVVEEQKPAEPQKPEEEEQAEAAG